MWSPQLLLACLSCTAGNQCVAAALGLSMTGVDRKVWVALLGAFPLKAPTLSFRRQSFQTPTSLLPRLPNLPGLPCHAGGNGQIRLQETPERYIPPAWPCFALYTSGQCMRRFQDMRSKGGRECKLGTANRCLVEFTCCNLIS